jgi:hypothetical protein
MDNQAPKKKHLMKSGIVDAIEFQRENLCSPMLSLSWQPIYFH